MLNLLRYVDSQVKVYQMNKWAKQLNDLYVNTLRIEGVNISWGSGLVEEEYTLTVCYKDVDIIRILTKGTRAYLSLISSFPLKKEIPTDVLFLYTSAVEPISSKGNVSLMPTSLGLEMFYNADLGSIYRPKRLTLLLGQMQYEMLNYWPLVIKNVDKKLGDYKAKLQEMFVQADNDN